MEHNKIVPDIISDVPTGDIEIIYPSGVSVNNGNELTPFQVKDDPNSVKWPANNGTFYTLFMIDPDGKSVQGTEKQILHWLIGNISGHDIQTGDCLAGYRGSGPPQGTGLHRYIFLVYKQNGKITFEETPLSKTSREGRSQFSLKKFTEKYNLGKPIAGNFYLAQYDEYVATLHANRTRK